MSSSNVPAVFTIQLYPLFADNYNPQTPIPALQHTRNIVVLLIISRNGAGYYPELV